MRKFWIYASIALLAAAPGIFLRLMGVHFSPLLDVLIAGLAILAAGFLLS